MKTPLEQAQDYAMGDPRTQAAFEDGFVAGMSYQVWKQTKKMMKLEAKANEVWERATKGLYRGS